MLYVPTRDAANAMAGVTSCAHRCSIPVARDPAPPQDPPIGGTSGRKMPFWPIGFTIALPKQEQFFTFGAGRLTEHFHRTVMNHGCLVAS